MLFPRGLGTIGILVVQHGLVDVDRGREEELHRNAIGNRWSGRRGGGWRGGLGVIVLCQRLAFGGCRCGGRLTIWLSVARRLRISALPG